MPALPFDHILRLCATALTNPDARPATVADEAEGLGVLFRRLAGQNTAGQWRGPNSNVRAVWLTLADDCGNTRGFGHGEGTNMVFEHPGGLLPLEPGHWAVRHADGAVHHSPTDPRGPRFAGEPQGQLGATYAQLADVLESLGDGATTPTDACTRIRDVADAGGVDGPAGRNEVRAALHLLHTSRHLLGLSEIDLQADFTGWDLSHANLSTMTLDHCDFTDADLTDTDLTYAELRGVNLTGANLRGANLTHARLRRADVDHGILNARGIRPGDYPAGLGRTAWDALLPTQPDVRTLTLHLLKDWKGTVAEAIATAEALYAP